MSPTGEIVIAEFEKVYGQDYISSKSSELQNCIESVTADTDLCEKATNFAYCFRDLDPDYLKIY